MQNSTTYPNPSRTYYITWFEKGILSYNLEQLVTIDLFGHPYTFKTDSEIGTVQQVADLLREEVAKVEEQQSIQASRLTVMILAALNIANQKHELQNKYTDMLDDISDRSARLIRLLDARLT